MRLTKKFEISNMLNNFQRSCDCGTLKSDIEDLWNILGNLQVVKTFLHFPFSKSWCHFGNLLRESKELPLVQCIMNPHADLGIGTHRPSLICLLLNLSFLLQDRILKMENENIILEARYSII